MNKRILGKIIATILVLIFTFSNVILLGVYAAGEELENQQTVVNHTKIEFDAYFRVEDKKVHSILADINTQDAKLYLSMKVPEGNLIHAEITVANSNFILKDYKDEQGMIQSIDSQNNKIYFNQINKGTEIELEIPIEIRKDAKIDTDYFQKESKVTLSGEYLNNQGEQNQIEKEIKVLLEIHGQENVVIEQTIDKYVPFKTESIQGTLIQTTIKAGIENDNLPMKQAFINIEVPVINHVKPTSVTVLGEEFSYNKETGILTISTKNEPENNQISWEKNGPTSYKIIYLYGEDAYTNEEIIIKQRVEATIEAYNNENTTANKISEGELSLKEKLNDNISNTVSFNKTELYKGFLYNGSQNETSYQTTWKADIAYTNLVNEISLSEEGDQYIIQEEAGETFLPNYAYYKTTWIQKDNFERILGTEGYIDIYDEQGNKIGTINKETQVDDNHNYVFNYSNETHNIIIKTSKPIENIMGEELVIEHNKVIKSETAYTLEQLKSFAGIKATVNQAEARIDLKEISTVAELSVNDNSLSTAISNNVEFTVALRTDSPSYQLFKNPIVEIKLPSYVENIELGNVDILFGNGELQVKGKEVIVDEEGNKIIRVTLIGEQKEYDLNSMAKGTNVFVSANITTRKLIPSQEANVEMICINQKDNSTSISSIKMNFESESGVLMANSIANYNGDEQKTSLKNDIQVGSIQMNAAPKIATMNMTLVNNERADINGAVILGRLPFEDNKTVVTGKELETTFSTELQSLIAMDGIDATIYYSENGEATGDLQNLDNKWSAEATTATKSYLIVLNDTFKMGETINFAYNIKIPENLGTDESAYSNYAIYYNNQAFESPIVGIETNKTVSTYNIQNILQQTEENPQKVNETISNVGEDKLQITSTYYNEYDFGEKITPNTQFSYVINIKNISYEKISDIDITDYLSDSVKYTRSNVEINKQEEDYGGNNITLNYDENEHKLICNVNQLDAKAEITIEIDVVAQAYTANGIINKLAIFSDGIQIYKNSTIQMKKPADITAKFASPTEEYVIEGQEIEYVLTVMNTGESSAGINILDELPEGLSFVSASYRINNEKIEIQPSSYNDVEIPYILLEQNQSLTMNITAKVEELEEDVQEKEIKNFVTITGDNVDTITDTVRHIAKKSQQYDPDDPSENKYSIKGTVWVDSDLNGRRDEMEQLLAEVPVKLMNSNSELLKETKTDSTGKYEFTNLVSGNYIVVFEYDSKLYSISEYQKEGVLDNLNSDAKETMIDGNKVAMTDVIAIEKSSKTNIDLGLTKNSLFDLKLDKYIDSITVQNTQGTTTYNYIDENFAKIELVAKQIPSTTVILQYRIIVTNEGDVPGYAKQIVDYLPQDLKFSSELNKDWYVNTDGNLYSSSLANEIINPGETKEINLIVTKKMNETNTGLVTNEAEIVETYNEQGISDYDSIPANRNQSEDDISTANVIIGVKTGGVVLYITITLICIGIIATGIYLINKKVLRGMK